MAKINTTIEDFIPAKVRKLQKLAQGTGATADRRRSKRISIEDINKFGAEQLLSEHGDEIKKAPDKRSAFTKVLDVIDIPRNVVANLIAKIAGVKPKEERPGALMNKVYASDLLEAMGVKPGIGRAIAGFVGDVALDPLTYATAGALTGTRISKALPKILGRGMKSLKGTAVAAVAGNIAGISADVARSLGRTPEQLVRFGQKLVKHGATPKGAIRRMMGPRGGLMTRALTSRALGAQGEKAAVAAREFITKFGEKGRTLLRVPFAATGLTARTGTRARLYKQIAAGVPKELSEKIAKASLGAKFSAATYESMRRAKEPKALITAGQLRGGRFAEKLKAKPGAQARVASAKEELKTIFQLPAEARTDKHLKQIKKLKRVIGRGGIDSADVSRFRQAQYGPEAKTAYRELRALERRAAALKQSGAEIPKVISKQITSSRKTLIKTLAEGGKELRKVVKFEKGRTRRMYRGAVFAGEKVKQIAMHPEAPLPMQLEARAIYGKPRLKDLSYLPGGGTVMQHIKAEASRIKQKLFGAGHSELGMRSAGAEAAMRSRGPASGQMAAQHFTETLKPVISRVSANSGIPEDEVARRLFDILDVKGAPKLVPSDPARAAIQEIRPFLDDAANKALREYRQTHKGLLDVMRQRGIAPGTIEPYVARKATKEFAKESGPHIERTLVDLGYDPKRVKELRWTDPMDGKQYSAFTGQTKEAQAAVADIKKRAAIWGDKPVAHDISVRRYNTDPEIAKSLLPPGRRGIVQQFKQTIPEAAEELVKQSIKRNALADLRDVSAPTGIRAELLKRQPHAYPGYAQPRWERYRDTPAYQTVFRQLEGQAFPQQVVDMLERFMTLSAQPEEIRNILRWTDKTLNLWKGVTLAHPGYTIRNIAQNLGGNVMAGQHMPSYLQQARPGSQVAKIVSATLKGQPVTGTILIGGRQMPAQQFAKMLTDHNLIMSGMIGEAMPNIMQAPGKFVRKIRPLHRWFALNANIESTMKAASLWAFLNQGYDARTALLKVAQAMPDLADLTLFERNVMRRVFPFFSWARKNGALQLFHYLPQKPAFIAASGKVKQAFEHAFSGDDVVPEELRPAWMQAQQAIQMSGDREQGSVFLAASWLPFQEVLKLGSGAFDVGEGARGLAEMARPSLRMIAERASGQDIFRRTPIEPVSAAGMVAAAPAGILGQGPLGGVLGVRPLREAFYRVPQIPTTAGKITRTMLGGAFQPVSRVRGLGAEYQRLRDLSVELRSKINRALQVNDQSLAEQLQRQYLQALIQMYQMGLPGVPKGTQAMFQQAGVQAGAPAFEGR